MSERLTKAQRTAIGLFVLEHALNGKQHAALLELVGALGVPSPEKASDGPATPTDPSPCTHPREKRRYVEQMAGTQLFRDFMRCECGKEFDID